MEAAGERFVRFAPFRDHDRIGVARIQESADILPELDRLALAGVVLDKGARHIHPETVAAFVKPESHDILHRLPGGEGFGRINRALPGLFRLGKAVVQRRLAGIEVGADSARPLRDAAQFARDAGHAGDRFPRVV